MKLLISIALLAETIAIVLSSCNRLEPERKIHSVNPLIGHWSFDSFSYGKDSNNLPLGYALFALAFYDGSRINIQFTKDSVFTFDDGKIEDRGAYHLTNKTEVVFTDASEISFQFALINDSLITLSKKDTITLFLKKN